LNIGSNIPMGQRDCFRIFFTSTCKQNCSCVILVPFMDNVKDQADRKFCFQSRLKFISGSDSGHYIFNKYHAVYYRTVDLFK